MICEYGSDLWCLFVCVPHHCLTSHANNIPQRNWNYLYTSSYAQEELCKCCEQPIQSQHVARTDWPTMWPTEECFSNELCLKCLFIFSSFPIRGMQMWEYMAQYTMWKYTHLICKTAATSYQFFLDWLPLSLMQGLPMPLWLTLSPSCKTSHYSLPCCIPCWLHLLLLQAVPSLPLTLSASLKKETGEYVRSNGKGSKWMRKFSGMERSKSDDTIECQMWFWTSGITSWGNECTTLFEY